MSGLGGFLRQTLTGVRSVAGSAARGLNSFLTQVPAAHRFISKSLESANNFAPLGEVMRQGATALG